MTTYMVCDENGDALMDGLGEHEARRTAQRMADSRATSVWLSESDSKGMGEEFSPDESDPVVAAKVQIDAWDIDNEEQSTIDDVFHAIFERWPTDSEDAVDAIYAARDVLTPDEARGVLRILWSNWPGFAPHPPITADDLVLCESADGWSLHAPGSADEQIANGDAPYLVSGPHPIGAADYAAALAKLRGEG